jgi:hypothetical protein
VFDAFFDTSITGANKPAAFTSIRYLWSIKTSTGATPPILPFVQVFDSLIWTTTISEFNDAAVGPTFTLKTLKGVPPGIRTKANLSGYMNNVTVGTFLDISSPSQTGNTAGMSAVANCTTGDNGQFALEVWTDTSQRIAVSAADAGTSVQVYCMGFVNTRGRFG